MKTVSLPFYVPKAFLYLRRSRSNHFQLYVNTTAFCKNTVSGTQIISICGRVFSCILLMSQTSCHENQCDKAKDIHGLQNPCVMQRLIYTRTHKSLFYHCGDFTLTYINLLETYPDLIYKHYSRNPNLSFLYPNLKPSQQWSPKCE